MKREETMTQQDVSVSSPQDKLREEIAKTIACVDYTLPARNCFKVADQILAIIEKAGYKSPEEVAGLENKIVALERERDGEVWYWLGDGYDHPESLCCPILIEPEDILKLISKQTGGKSFNKINRTGEVVA